MVYLGRFSPDNKTVKKKKKKHSERPGRLTKDDCLLLTGGEHEANQCAVNQSSIRGALSLGGDWTERHD